MDKLVERMLQATYFSKAPVSSGAGTLERVDLDTRIAEELSKLPPCESGQYHEDGVWGHVPEQYASFLMIPACGHDKLICRGWVENTLQGNWVEFKCSRCSQTSLVADMCFVPLDMTGA